MNSCHVGRDATAGSKCRHQFHLPGLNQLDQVIQDRVGDMFIEDSVVAITLQVHLETL